MNIIWGDRIGLRRFEDYLTDAQIARVYRWSCDRELLRWSGGTPTELTLSEFRDRLRGDSHFGPNHRRAFFIVTRTGELIGRVGCFAIDWDEHEAELGIVIGETAYWGQGYGREAILTMLRHLFQTTSLERINLFTFNDNVRAQRCFAACGFRTVGAVRRFSPDVGEFDGVEMEITRREFLADFKLPMRQIPVSQDML
ncbi:MAG: GNAT family N-acetyltransferase [Chloroflexi bacterium]|nr:GNAT family N-acetyltransferase [Chloroflexota bacterium]